MLGMEMPGVTPFLGVRGGTTADLGLYLVSLPQSSGMNFNERVPADCLRPENSTAPLNPKSPQSGSATARGVPTLLGQCRETCGGTGGTSGGTGGW